MMATVGIDPCVAIYSAEQWTSLLERLSRLSLSKGRSRDFLRVILASACELEPDSTGRILLPQHLRAYAGLKEDASIIGVSDRLEIWDRGRWENRREQVLMDLSLLAEEVDAL
jgi:MraZ protein